MTEPKKSLRVRDLSKPPMLEDWMWEEILEQMGGLILAKKTDEKGLVVGLCDDCGHVHPIEASLMLTNQENVEALKKRIRQMYHEGGGLGGADMSWQQEDADWWKG